MSGKKGRPRKAIVQEKNIGFYVTFAQWDIIRRKMEKAHANISDYMRQMAVQGEVRGEESLSEVLAVEGVRAHECRAV